MPPPTTDARHNAQNNKQSASSGAHQVVGAAPGLTMCKCVFSHHHYHPPSSPAAVQHGHENTIHKHITLPTKHTETPSLLPLLYPAKPPPTQNHPQSSCLASSTHYKTPQNPTHKSGSCRGIHSPPPPASSTNFNFPTNSAPHNMNSGIAMATHHRCAHVIGWTGSIEGSCSV